MTDKPEEKAVPLIELLVQKFLRRFNAYRVHASENDNSEYISEQIQAGNYRELHMNHNEKVNIVIVIEDDRTKGEKDEHSPTGSCCK